jgi:hypothetical protein
MKKKWLLACGLSIILILIIIKCSSGRGVNEYYGVWSNGYSTITIKEAGESNSVIVFREQEYPYPVQNIFCTYKDGCFYEAKSGDGVVCETGDFHLIFNGSEYGLFRKGKD